MDKICGNCKSFGYNYFRDTTWCWDGQFSVGCYRDACIIMDEKEEPEFYIENMGRDAK